MAGNRLQHVVRHAHLGELGDHGVPEVVEAEARQARGVTQRAPGRVPLQHGLLRVEASPLASWPQVVLRLGVAEQVRPLEHPREGFQC
jgi:hypothetical protein